MIIRLNSSGGFSLCHFRWRLWAIQVAFPNHASGTSPFPATELVLGAQPQPFKCHVEGQRTGVLWYIWIYIYMDIYGMLWAMGNFFTESFFGPLPSAKPEGFTLAPNQRILAEWRGHFCCSQGKQARPDLIQQRRSRMPTDRQTIQATYVLCWLSQNAYHMRAILLPKH